MNCCWNDNNKKKNATYVKGGFGQVTGDNRWYKRFAIGGYNLFSHWHIPTQYTTQSFTRRLYSCSTYTDTPEIVVDSENTFNLIITIYKKDK